MVPVRGAAAPPRHYFSVGGYMSVGAAQVGPNFVGYFLAAAVAACPQLATREQVSLNYYTLLDEYKKCSSTLEYSM